MSDRVNASSSFDGRFFEAAVAGRFGGFLEGGRFRRLAVMGRRKSILAPALKALPNQDLFPSLGCDAVCRSRGWRDNTPNSQGATPCAQFNLAMFEQRRDKALRFAFNRERLRH